MVGTLYDLTPTRDEAKRKILKEDVRLNFNDEMYSKAVLPVDIWQNQGKQNYCTLRGVLI